MTFNAYLRLAISSMYFVWINFFNNYINHICFTDEENEALKYEIDFPGSEN